MTIEVQDYRTRKRMRIGKDKRVLNGWRSLHTDFINNKESEGFRVTFVNGLDNEENTEEGQTRKLRTQLIQLLYKRIESDTISFKELKMLMRLESDMKLLPSTLLKFSAILQGGVTGFIQKLKNLFNL